MGDSQELCEKLGVRGGTYHMRRSRLVQRYTKTTSGRPFRRLDGSELEDREAACRKASNNTNQVQLTSLRVANQ